MSSWIQRIKRNKYVATVTKVGAVYIALEVLLAIGALIWAFGSQ